MENWLRRVFRRKGAGSRRSLIRGAFTGLLGFALILGGGATSASGAPSATSPHSAAGAGLGIQPMASSSSGPSYKISWAYLDFEREYHWRLEKTGQVDEVTLGQGSATADLDYTVSAIPDGYSDLNRLIRVRGEFQNNLIPKTIHPKARATVGGEVIECTTRIIGDRGSLVGPNSGRQLRADCPISSHNNSDDISVTAWVDWGRIGVPDGSSRDSASDDIEDNMIDERYKSVEVVDNKTEPGQEYSLGTAQWNSSGDAEVFEYSVEKTDLDTGACTSIENQAEIKGLDKVANNEIQICPDAELTIESTTNASYDLEYGWDLAKSGNLKEIELSGDSAVAHLDYAVTATPDGSAKINPEVSGQIKVHNPNSRGAKHLTIESTLQIDGDTEYCEVTYHDGGPAHNVSAGPGSTAVFNYTCDLDGPVPDNATAMAKVIWNQDRDGTGETETTSNVNFRLNNEVDRLAQIYDDKTSSEGPFYLGTAD